MTLECRDAGSCHSCYHALQVSSHPREGEDQSWTAHTLPVLHVAELSNGKSREMSVGSHTSFSSSLDTVSGSCVWRAHHCPHTIAVSIWCLLMSQRETGRTVVRSILPIIPEKQCGSRKGPLPSPVPQLPEKEYFSALCFLCWFIIHDGCVYILDKMSPC